MTGTSKPKPSGLRIRSGHYSQKATSTPSGLTLTSLVDQSIEDGDCVHKEGSAHLLEAHNETLLPFHITVKGQCETDLIRYATPQGPEQLWKREFWVLGRPERAGGANSRGVYKNLTSLGSGDAEMLSAEVTWAPAAWPASPPEVIRLSVRTV
jgi:hypothetical protein